MTPSYLLYVEVKTLTYVAAMINHSQAEHRHTDSQLYSSSRLSLLTKWQLTSIFDLRVDIYDLYFTWDSWAEEVEEFAVLGVHDGSLDELHHRVAAVLKLRVTPQAERPWRERGMCFFSLYVAFYHL